jgi:hypothetical protein
MNKVKRFVAEMRREYALWNIRRAYKRIRKDLREALRDRRCV